MTAAVAQVLVDMAAKVKDKVADWVTMGGNLIDGLKQGFMNKLSGVTSAIANGAKSIAAAAKSALGIASPSKVFKEIGEFCAEGFGVGWEDEIGAVNKQVEDDLKYDAQMDVSTSVSNNTEASTTRLLSDADVTKLAEALSINFTNVTNIDGNPIKQETYEYTVQRVGDETRAERVAKGGYY